MSVAVCRGPAMPAFETPAWLRPAEPYKPEVVVVAADDRPAQVDIWNAIQADVDYSKAAAAKKQPYVSPRVRRSMSQKSLEICTESLGCETGSGDFTASLDAVDMSRLFGSPLPTAPVEAEDSFWERSAAQESYPGDDLVAVNYHSSGGRRSPRRSFPPPLPSMSSRDGPCLKMCSRRQDGRLVVEAVVVRPRGYLQANRQGGRLCLSFIECSARGQSAARKSAVPTEASYFPVVDVDDKCEQEQEVAMQVEEEEEDEEEVEVVDRGTVVEVKVSSQPQAAAAAKVHRSTLVINKFVGSTPFTFEQARCHADAPHSKPSARDETPTLRRVPSSTTTLAAAVAVASTETGAPHTPIDGDEDDDDVCGVQHQPSALAAADTKQQLLLFTSRRGDKHDLLQSVRRCRQLRQKPLFILEQYCIATS